VLLKGGGTSVARPQQLAVLAVQAVDQAGTRGGGAGAPANASYPSRTACIAVEVTNLIYTGIPSAPASARLRSIYQIGNPSTVAFLSKCATDQVKEARDLRCDRTGGCTSVSGNPSTVSESTFVPLRSR